MPELINICDLETATYGDHCYGFDYVGVDLGLGLGHLGCWVGGCELRDLSNRGGRACGHHRDRDQDLSFPLLPLLLHLYDAGLPSGGDIPHDEHCLEVAECVVGSNAAQRKYWPSTTAPPQESNAGISLAFYATRPQL